MQCNIYYLIDVILTNLHFTFILQEYQGQEWYLKANNNNDGVTFDQSLSTTTVNANRLLDHTGSTIMQITCTRNVFLADNLEIQYDIRKYHIKIALCI